MFGLVQAVPQVEIHALLSAQSLRRGQAVRSLDDRELPRELRHLRVQRHPVQSREPACAAGSSSPARSPTASRRSNWASSTCLALGNLDAKRDWGFAKEYVEGMWRMLQATSRTPSCSRRTVPKPCATSCGWRSRPPKSTSSFQASDEQEFAVDAATGKTVMQVDRQFYRPAEVDLLIGDPAKAKEKLGWEPKTSLEELCRMMVEADLRRNQAGFSF